MFDCVVADYVRRIFNFFILPHTQNFNFIFYLHNLPFLICRIPTTVQIIKTKKKYEEREIKEKQNAI